MSQKTQRPPLNASLTPLTCLEVLPSLTPAQVTREFQNLKLADNNFTVEYKRKILFKHFDLRITSEFTGSTFSNIWNLLYKNQNSLAGLENQIRDVNYSVQSLRGQVKKANMINSVVAPAEEITRNVFTTAPAVSHFSDEDETFKMVPQLTRQDTDEGQAPVRLDSNECDNVKPLKLKRQIRSEQNVHLWKTASKKMLRESCGERRKISRQASGDKRKILTRQSTADSASAPVLKENHHKSGGIRPGSRWSTILNIFVSHL